MELLFLKKEDIEGSWVNLSDFEGSSFHMFSGVVIMRKSVIYKELLGFEMKGNVKFAQHLT